MNNKIDTPWKRTERHTVLGRNIKATYGTWREDRTETILSAERRLAHVLFLVLGFSWLMLFAFDFDNTWYGIGIVLCWSATGFAIVYRWFMDVKNGVIYRN